MKTARLLLLASAIGSAAFPSPARPQPPVGAGTGDAVQKDIKELNRLLEGYREPPPPPRKRPPPEPPAAPPTPLPSAVDALVEILLAGERPERAAAQRHLIDIGAGAVEELSLLLTGGDERAGITAAGLLGLIGEGAAVVPLAAALESPSRRLRASSAAALGRIDDPAALPPLFGALGDRDAVVREASLRALFGKGKSAVPWLIEAVGIEDGRVGKQAAAALADLTGESFGEDLPAWREWWEESGGKIPATGGSTENSAIP